VPGGRTNKHTFGNLGPNSCEAIGVLEEINDLMSSSLAPSMPATSPKGDWVWAPILNPGLALAGKALAGLPAASWRATQQEDRTNSTCMESCSKSVCVCQCRHGSRLLSFATVSSVA